jgi:Tol biopolymer transport system component
MRQLTTEGARARGAAGRLVPGWPPVLFESRRTGTSDLWIAEVETGELRQLTTDVRDDQDGRWSPDGQWIAFQSNRGGQWDTWVMPASGGEATRVTADLATESPPVWATSGASLLHVSSLATARMMHLSTEDGASRQVFGWTGHSIADLQPSPDGRTIAFISNRSGSPGIWVVPSEGGEPRPVSAGTTTEHQPRWSPDGRQLAFTSSRTGQPGVWITADTGTTQRRLVDWDAHTDQHAWSPDGTRIALHSARDARDYDIWVVPVDRGEATRLTTGLFADFPQWSPDGNTIYFTARQPEGGSQVQRVPATGGVTTGLGPVAQVNGHRLSPDGQHLAYALIGGGWAFIEVVPTTGGTPRRLTVETEQVFHGQPEWAPDGSQLVVTASNFETSGSNLFTVTWPEGAWRQLTTSEGNAFGARWLPQGQGLVYVHATSMGSLRVVDLTGILREIEP